jgi:CheY-like chemotaxis protein
MNASCAVELGAGWHTLLVGDVRHGEFPEAITWLRQRTRCAVVSDVAAAQQYCRQADAPPQLVVLCQPHRDCFSPVDIERLHAAAPLARLVALLGSTCEGEVRSGRPWPGVLRIYWHQWQGRARAELLPLLEGACSSWSLPRTATTADQALFVADRPAPHRSGLVAVRAPRVVDYEALAEVCETLGATPLWLPPGRPALLRRPDLLVWDSDGRQGHELDRLADLVQRIRPTRVLALLGFPRREEAAAARAAGADQLLSKPCLLGDLLASLADLLPPAGKRLPESPAA